MVVPRGGGRRGGERVVRQHKVRAANVVVSHSSWCQENVVVSTLVPQPRILVLTSCGRALLPVVVPSIVVVNSCGRQPVVVVVIIIVVKLWFLNMVVVAPPHGEQFLWCKSRLCCRHPWWLWFHGSFTSGMDSLVLTRRHRVSRGGNC